MTTDATVLNQRSEAVGDPLIGFEPGTTLAGKLAEHAERRADDPALTWRGPSGAWESFTWAQYGARAADVAEGLRRLGVERGDVVAIVLRNSWEFHVVASGAQLLGAATVSFYANTPPEQLEQLWFDCGAAVLVTDSVSIVEAFRREVREEMTVIGVDPDLEDVCDVTLAEVARHSGDLQTLASAVTEEDLLQIVYTSGTTGVPKGVLSTHGAMARGAHSTLQGSGVDLESGAMVSYLPMAHNAERITTLHLHSYSGAHVLISASPAVVLETLQQAHPTLFFGVPLIWERLARRAMELESSGQDRESVLRELGMDRLKVGITGAAPTADNVIAYFRDIGLPLSDMYGMSETLSGSTWSPHAHRVGAVGRPMPGVAVRIAEDGEILLRQPGLTSGYLRRPDETAVLLEDDWIHSGDLGWLDADGYLHLRGRKKDLLVTSGGRNISPSPIEAALRADEEVIDVVLVGDGRPYVTAVMVVTDPTSEPVADAIATLTARVNSTLPAAERVHRIALLSPEQFEGERIRTPLGKIKRSEVFEHLTDVVIDLYAPAPGPLVVIV